MKEPKKPKPKLSPQQVKAKAKALHQQAMARGAEREKNRKC